MLRHRGEYAEVSSHAYCTSVLYTCSRVSKAKRDKLENSMLTLIKV